VTVKQLLCRVPISLVNHRNTQEIQSDRLQPTSVTMIILSLSSLLLLSHCTGFLITDAEPGVLGVAPGERVTLFCAVDDHYEWCKFISPSGQECDFEWKRSEGNITMQQCTLSNRVTFHGKYDDMECGITFLAEEGDTGVWKCEIEEYVTWRSRGAGRIQTAEMNITVRQRTTHQPETTLATQTTLLTTQTTQTPLLTTQTTETINTKTTESQQSKASVKQIEDKEDNEIPEAVPRVDEHSNSKATGSSSALIGVVVVIVLIVVAVSGVFYYRKRKASSTAAVAYDKEAKTNHDQTTMVANSNTNITFHSNNSENSNLHEYYPPNLTYSTVTPESQA